MGMPIWLIAIGAALSATFGCGRVGFEEQSNTSSLAKDAGPTGDADAAPDAGVDGYSADASPDQALQQMNMGMAGSVDGK